MSELRETKPRPIKKLYGLLGPSEEQLKAWNGRMREWNAKYRYASKEQKTALDRENKALWERFHPHTNPHPVAINHSVPKKALALGRVLAIIYESAKDGQHYRHDFRTNSRPHLAVSLDGKQLLIVGGQYQVTQRGIEDK